MGGSRKEEEDGGMTTMLFSLCVQKYQGLKKSWTHLLSFSWNRCLITKRDPWLTKKQVDIHSGDDGTWMHGHMLVLEHPTKYCMQQISTKSYKLLPTRMTILKKKRIYGIGANNLIFMQYNGMEL